MGVGPQTRTSKVYGSVARLKERLGSGYIVWGGREMNPHGVLGVVEFDWSRSRGGLVKKDDVGVETLRDSRWETGFGL